jgi:hypothetical protein
MRGMGLMSCVVFVCVAACGGADNTLIPDSGPDTGGGDSGPVDAGNDTTPPANCDGGMTSCNGSCVDTSSDPQNCGGCGVVCNTTCTAGVCQLIGGSCDVTTAPVGDFACIAVDSASIYWGTGQSSTNGGAVWKIPINGGCPQLLAGQQEHPHGIASDGTNVYYANYGTTNVLGGVYSVPVGGGTPTPIATTQAAPLDVVVDANNVYWTDSGDGSVWKSNKTGTPNPVRLVNGAGQGHASYLRVDSTNVYYTDHSTGAVYRVPIAGGNAAAMTTTGVTGVGHIAIDSTTAYFGSGGGGTAGILTVDLTASGATPNQSVTGLKTIAGIDTDGTNLWFAEPTNVQPWQANTGVIHRATVAGANDTPLATQQNGPDCVVVDSSSVYWINTGGSGISKTGK